MKVIITGAGDVGYHLAKLMASEAKDIYLIDENEDRLQQVAAHIDVFTIRGDAKSIDVLKDAKVDSCDLLIAVTSSEETNLLVSILGKKFGAKRTIARINDLEILNNELKGIYNELGVDELISPVDLITKEIRLLLNRSVFTDDLEFEGGKLSVFGITLGEKSPLIDRTVKESAYLNPNLDFKPIALHRNEETLIVNSETLLKYNDIVYFSAPPQCIDRVIEICGRECFEIKDIMILGGSRIGVMTAQFLEKDFNVTLIERDRNKCEKIAGKLKRTLVVNIDARDVESLENEGLNDMDAFISVTGDSETNIMSCLVAKSHGVKKTIAGVENIDYIHLSQAIGIDTLINKKIIAASNIFKHVRRGEVDAIASLHGVDAEVIEFTVKEGTKITKKPIRDLDFPKIASIAGVIRNGKGFIPFGNFTLKAGDKAVVFSSIESIAKIERFFL